jgi:hypothetical protein
MRRHRPDSNESAASHFRLADVVRTKQIGNGKEIAAVPHKTCAREGAENQHDGAILKYRAEYFRRANDQRLCPCKHASPISCLCKLARTPITRLHYEREHRYAMRISMDRRAK